MEKIKVGIIGAGGYGGCGAIEILLGHPKAEIKALIDNQDVGKAISDLLTLMIRAVLMILMWSFMQLRMVLGKREPITG